MAKIAEEMYPHITSLYQYWPKEKTQFIIRDTDDYSNGGAYFYDNKVEIWAENMDYILRGTHNWLRDVVSHEFTHIISLRKALKFGPHVPAGWFQIFGYETERRPDVVRGFPDVLVSYPISGITIPVWFAEGTAQFQTPSQRYDYRDSHREMILRDRVVTGKLLDLKEMGVFGKNSIGNESSYNQGYAFVSFLAKTFGDSIVKKLMRQAAAPLTLDFNRVMQSATGVPADSIFRMWENYLDDTYNHRLQTVKQNLTIGEAVQDEGIGNINPVFSPDGEEIAYVKSTSDYLSVNVLAIKNLKTEKERLVDGPITSSVSWSPSGRYLAYSKQTNLQSNGSSFNDIYVYDTKRYKTYQITKGL
ncbi:MAG: biopolymer transporter Tol, partial [Calditrichota bacterium]